MELFYGKRRKGRALVYSKGYREKSHYFLLVALQSLFAEKGLLEQKLVRSLHNAMILREDADYHGEFSKEGAKLVLELAEKFIRVSEKILKIKTE